MIRTIAILATAVLVGISFIDVPPVHSLQFPQPANFPPPVYDYRENPLTDAGFRLGRQLFYDPLLSKDSTISCGNCHQYFAAFANLDHEVSHGVDGCLGTRNAPPLFNLCWQREFMWDGGVKHIELSPLNALTNPCEMASSLDTIVARLRSAPGYPGQFDTVFGSPEINSQRVLKALAQFTGMLVSANSRYDRHVRSEPGGLFSAEEEKGYSVFKADCATCHREPLFTDLSYRDNGLDSIYSDPGRDTITYLAADKGRFRVPSLRNIALTSPYMHDGRFSTLDEVLEHYNSGMRHGPNLDTILQRGNRLGIALDRDARKALIAFLQTLTDSLFITDKRFQPSE
ncbi:MAG TPA: cytochrome c peroxidase [Puia sp.]|nr:cytochrome c peroxidase [Puia sp.]